MTGRRYGPWIAAAGIIAGLGVAAYEWWANARPAAAAPAAGPGPTMPAPALVSAGIGALSTFGPAPVYADVQAPLTRSDMAMAPAGSATPQVAYHAPSLEYLRAAPTPISA